MNFWQKINQWWLWLTIFAIPFSVRKVIAPVFHQGVFVDYASTSLFLSDLLIGGLLLLWAMDFKRTGRFNWGPKCLTLPLLLLAGWMCLSLVWAKPDVWMGVQAALRFLLYVGFYFYLINRVADIKALLYPLMAGMVVQSGLAIAQYFTNHSLGLKWLGESVLDPIQSGIPVVLIDGARQLRAHGTLPHANVLGGYLVMGLAMMWPLLFDRGRLINRLSWWWVAGIGLIGLILSLSRSAGAALIGGGLVVLIWLALKHSARLRQSLRIGWPIILAVVIVALTQWQAVVPRWSADSNLIEQISVRSRQEQWQEFKKVYANYSVTGTGIGQYFLNIWQPAGRALLPGGQLPGNPVGTGQADSWQYRSDLGGWSYSTDRSLNYYQPVHNIYLLALAELGPVGLGLLMWILGAAAYLAVRLGRRGRLWGVAGLWATVTIAVIGLVDHYWWTLPSGRLMFMLGLSLVGVLWVNSDYNGKYGRTES
ncbi:hypothetical protein A2994_02420 [candidate division Kazan bacterium RIFCSPLOWO2_01_FULL_48_13]|uniref:O-antigen ligase-related domain-containing protein n=1 Tax=candidate division Kazan bacterium RIFCSPLOWO2_01_FULL_48_13 TaxID=1798539 RepID=A0A1F4PP93_UNCK3|nr:MAG: hypothetical protein A2994_02420 [candidate division Kazan bacterium RIFCSPLOWO2_01_FULL_48_13]